MEGMIINIQELPYEENIMPAYDFSYQPVPPLMIGTTIAAVNKKLSISGRFSIKKYLPAAGY